MSNVDVKIEPVVREAFAAAVRRDSARFEQALKAIPPGEAEAALKLAFGIDSFLARDIFDAPPTTEDMNELANEFVAMESWFPASELPATQFFRMLGGIRDDNPPDPSQLALLCFLVGGWLLSAFLDETSDQDWVDRLDEVLEAIDRLPGTTDG